MGKGSCYFAMVAAIDVYQPAPPQTQTGARNKRPRQGVPYAQLQAQVFVARHEPRVRPDAVNHKPDVDTPRCNTKHWHVDTTQAREKRRAVPAAASSVASSLAPSASPFMMYLQEIYSVHKCRLDAKGRATHVSIQTLRLACSTAAQTASK